MAKEYIKEYIKPIPETPFCHEATLRDKLNEVIEYINGGISVGLFHIPDGYKEEKK